MYLSESILLLSLSVSDDFIFKLSLANLYFYQFINCISLSASTVFLRDPHNGGGVREHTVGASW